MLGERFKPLLFYYKVQKKEKKYYKKINHYGFKYPFNYIKCIVSLIVDTFSLTHTVYLSRDLYPLNFPLKWRVSSSRTGSF